MKISRITLLTVLISFLTACVSSNHLGVTQYENGSVFCRTINMKTAEAAKQFEEQIIKIIISSQLDDLMKYMSDKFKKNMTTQDWDKIRSIIKGDDFNGAFDSKRIVWRFVSYDEAIAWDGFEKYHFLVAIYRLHGKVDADLIMEYRKYEDGIKLVGLGLSNTNMDIADRETNASFAYRFLDHIPSDESIPYRCGMFFP